MSFAPIALFAYARPEHLRRTVESLLANPEAGETDLYVFCDAPRSDVEYTQVSAVRSYVDEIKGFRSITRTYRDKNLGLAKSIISGVGEVLEKYDRLIVVEDDLLVSPHFLRYMNDGLSMYAQDGQVASIHGFIYPIENLPETFFIRGSDCWGWATWARAWRVFNPNGQELLDELEGRKLNHIFDFYGQYPYIQMLKDQIAGRNSSWAIRWLASTFLKEMLTLYPGKSLVKNIGFDEGTHNKNGTDQPSFGVLSDSRVSVRRIAVEHNEAAYLKMSEFFRSQRRSLFARILRRLRRILGRFGSKMQT